SWDNIIGGDAVASMEIVNGGTVSTEGDIYMGGSAGSKGSVTVSGDGSSLHTNSLMAIGPDGDGFMTVEDGGLVTFAGLYVGGGGPAYTGSGALTVAGERAMVVGASDVQIA